MSWRPDSARPRPIGDDPPSESDCGASSACFAESGSARIGGTSRMATVLSESHDAPPGLPGRLDHFVAGAWTPSADGATFGVTDPVTNRTYAEAAAAGAADVDRAVAAAHRAFPGGPSPGLASRGWARQPTPNAAQDDSH